MFRTARVYFLFVEYLDKAYYTQIHILSNVNKPVSLSRHRNKKHAVSLEGLMWTLTRTQLQTGRQSASKKQTPVETKVIWVFQNMFDHVLNARVRLESQNAIFQLSPSVCVYVRVYVVITYSF